MRTIASGLTVIALILFVANSASAQMVAPLPPGTRTISVTGHGSVKAKPDELIVSFTVSSKAATGDECTRLQSEKASKVVDALKVKLDGNGEVQTSNYSLSPVYESVALNAPAATPTPTSGGWSSTVQIQAMADQLEEIGTAIQAAMAAGADRVVQSGIQEAPINPGTQSYRSGLFGRAQRRNSDVPIKNVPWVNLEVRADGATPVEAVNRCAQAAKRVEKAVADKIGTNGTVRIEEFTVIQINQQNRPYYQMPQQPSLLYQQKQSYAAHTTVTATTRNIDLLGSMIEAGMAAGASQVDSVSFTLSTDAAARNDAIAVASKDAKSKARALAGSMGVQLGKALGISINAQPQPQVISGNNLMMHRAEMPRGMQASLAEQQMPVLPREVGFSADVSVVYEIQ